MQSLPSWLKAHSIARLVLLWFALSIGAAIASPLVKPQNLQLICSASGASKLIAGGVDDQGDAAQQHLHCPLCAALGAPPPLEIISFSAAPPLRYALPVQELVRVAPIAAAPPPSRGPPTFS